MAGAGGDKPSADAGPSPLSRVLRISQLDAFELDGALEQLVWSQFTQCFQHFKPGLLTPVEPELKALLQLLLWRFTVYSNSATVGQSLLNIRYKDARVPGHKYRPMSRQKKLWFALLTVGEKWLKERSHSLFLNHPAESSIHKARKLLSVVMGLTKAASLVNFLLFLQTGTFPTLTERLLRVQPVFIRPQGPRDVNFQFLNRELLWHGFAEFLIFLLPLINVWKLKVYVSTMFSPLNELRRRSEVTYCTECAICREWPTMPHSIGCNHVFCYYCLKSHAIADISFTCPKCGADAATMEPVRLQIEMTELHQS
ncbi:peroxisome biogenesis factor 2 [Triplophysa rosa]|uniref:Peroxisome biogenesis factor 2 n=1 Tax=Triplophysa rosa TaxID=992332 RepID=A0A9W7T8X3_TRIRA|nr:peroxisome biogenesis factor 2 [Triplophysa rosa]KAI7792386.1 putative peroxisome biogenesis factor 2 [Triplophysa rosa]